MKQATAGEKCATSEFGSMSVVIEYRDLKATASWKTYPISIPEVPSMKLSKYHLSMTGTELDQVSEINLYTLVCVISCMPQCQGGLIQNPMTTVTTPALKEEIAVFPFKNQVY